MSARSTTPRRKPLTRTVVLVLCAGLHVVVFSLIALRPSEPAPPESPPVVVALVDGQNLIPKPETAAMPKASPKPLPARVRVRLTPAPPDVRPLPIPPVKVAAAGQGLSEAEIAGAASGDAGSPGGGCDMRRRLAAALRKDPIVAAAAARLAGKAVMVWNGDWVRSAGEDGAGLSAVRESILGEVGFAPEACRTERVHGLVLFTLPGGRLALGAPDWRWSDLLKPTGRATGP